MAHNSITRKLAKTKVAKQNKLTQDQIHWTLQALKEVMFKELHKFGEFHWHGMFKIKIFRVMGFSTTLPDGRTFFQDDYNKITIKPSTKLREEIKYSEGVDEVGY